MSDIPKPIKIVSESAQCFVREPPKQTITLVMLLSAGGRSGESMLDVDDEHLRMKIPVWLDTCGARVAYQENPLAVVIVTPIMARVHSSQFACDMCFVDSTASCHTDNHMITSKQASKQASVLHKTT